MSYFNFLLFVLIFVFPDCWADCPGCIALDESNLEKLMDRFSFSLIKFDRFDQTNDEDAFSGLAKDLTEVGDLLVATVAISAETDELAKKYGIKSNDNLPKIILFKSSYSGKPFDEFVFKAEEGKTEEESLKNFLRKHAELYKPLLGCFEELDELVVKFAQVFKEGLNLEEIILKTENVVENKIQKESKKRAEMYPRIMKKISTEGVDIIANEKTRVKKLTRMDLPKEKLEDLHGRMNILTTFEKLLIPKKKKEENEKTKV